MTLTLNQLLQPHGFDPAARVRMVRHRDPRYDMDALINRGHFDTYQSFQGRPVFECRSLVSFVGEGGTRSRFLGVYHVRGRKGPGGPIRIPPGFPFPEMLQAPGHYLYDLQRDSRFDHLINRVVIDWGKGTRSWVQKYRDREVIEVLPVGYVREFPGYLDFVLTHRELVQIVRNPAANREWHRSLAAVAGIYLITDLTNGQQYVGSAHGQGGILGRWRSYAQRPDGGNDRLIKVLQSHPGREENFQFTLLRTLDKALSKNEVVAIETIYKHKLGSRAFGLNSN